MEKAETGVILSKAKDLSYYVTLSAFGRSLARARDDVAVV